MIAGWVALAIVLALMAAATCAAHIPVLRDWTGAAPLEPEPDVRPDVRPDDQPGGTLRHALDADELLDDLPGRRDHRTD